MKKGLLLVFMMVLVMGLVSAEVNSVTPSTNDINRVNGWAYVNEEAVDVGEITLEFVSTRSFWSCFEYRSDGDTGQKISDTNHNLDVTDGLYPYYCQNNNARTETLYADEYVEVRMVFGAETDERFDWTRFDVLLATPPDVTPPLVTIEAPADESFVSGVVDVYGTIVEDEAMGNYNIAVYPGDADFMDFSQRLEQASGYPGTGFFNQLIYQWNTVPYSDGAYLIRFAARDAAGNRDLSGDPYAGGDDSQHVITVYVDNDGDGVAVGDLCPGTVADEPTESLGVNRHVWDGEKFVTLVPAGRGTFSTVDSEFSIEGTYGCSCEQILDSMSETLEMDMDGHYKYGCSKSVIEAWVAGEYYFGPTFVETVEVDSSNINGAYSSVTKADADYFLTARGTWQNSNLNTLDAECRLNTGQTIWELSSPRSLRLQVDGDYFLWGDECSADNTYTASYIGLGSSIWFRIVDGNPPVASWYNDNVGSLHVDIYEDLWVSLW